MANSAQAKKRARQSEKRRQANGHLRASMRTLIKRVRAAIESGDKEVAASAYKKSVPAIDSLVGKGLVHKNTAARNKSRLNAAVKAL